MRTIICYKLHNPLVFNKGTKYEKREDTFLECYVYGDDSEEKAQAKCDELNKTVTDRVYFISKQKEM